MQDDVPEVLTALARAFARLEARWYVFGAQAVITAGVPRLTADIDVTVEEPAHGAPVDVVLAGPGIEEEMLSRTHLRKVGASQIPFVDTADLIALKILAGRDKDLEDVRALVRAAPPDLVLSVARQ